MAMGQQKDRQGDLLVSWYEMPRSPGHVFYDRPRSVLIEGGFDACAEEYPPALLRGQDGGAFGAAGALFPHVPGGLLRGHRRQARAGVAVLGFSVAARIPAAGEPGCAGARKCTSAPCSTSPATI